MSLSVNRSGQYVRQPGGYKAFIPRSLPPDPPVDYSNLVVTLAEASEAIGRLDGVARLLPDPAQFVAMYVRREAELSSRIEGTESTLDDMLTFELQGSLRHVPPDAAEVSNNVRALNYGIKRLESLPLSNRLIREMHAILMEDVRGQERMPGSFRTSQNWIGSPGATLVNATYVPPPAHEVPNAMGELELFLHHRGGMPVLVHAGLAHAQFEMIHPFLDGNGRVGRLLITILLQHHGVLRYPLLYLSSYLQKNRSEYYAWLNAVREPGDWEGWLLFFLRGVVETANASIVTSQRVVALRERDRTRVTELRLRSGTAALEYLYGTPVTSVNDLVSNAGIPYSTASTLIRRFEELGILREVTNRRRDRVYRYDAYVDLFREAF